MGSIQNSMSMATHRSRVADERTVANAHHAGRSADRERGSEPVAAGRRPPSHALGARRV
jgi:hypothetical protein